MMILQDQVVVITGASKGLGKELARLFVQEKSKVIICSRKKKDVQKAAREIGAVGKVTDVSKEKDVHRLAQAVIKRFGKIDVWINNAGIRLSNVPLEELDMRRVHQLIEVNLFGTIYGCKEAVLQMRKQKEGCIINIQSTSALEGRAYSTAYCASKYASTGFTKALRKEVDKQGIIVLSVYPGGMKTDFFNEQMPENYSEFMDPMVVARKIVENLKEEKPEEELILKRN